MWEFEKFQILSMEHRVLPSCGLKARETMLAKYEIVL